jgi:hypothetical protein
VIGGCTAMSAAVHFICTATAAGGAFFCTACAGAGGFFSNVVFFVSGTGAQLSS